MGPEALQFGQESLSVGAQPIRLRKFLSDKFQTHLITKNVINLKQSLACNWNRSVQFWHVISCLFLPKGTAESKWHDTVEVLVELADENSKNIFNDSEGNEKCRANIALVLHDDREFQDIYFHSPKGNYTQLSGRSWLWTLRMKPTTWTSLHNTCSMR